MAKKVENPSLAKQTANPLDGNEDGITVTFDGKDRYKVKYPYDPVLTSMIHKIEGGEFDKDTKTWSVPLAQYDTLAASLGKMREEVKETEIDTKMIMADAAFTASKLMEQNGIKNVEPQISDYRSTKEATRGEIINVNGRYAAQFTGFGKENGAAFVRIHRLSDLDTPLYKGDNVAIAYDEKFRGTVTETSKAIFKQFDDSMGETIDGVKVQEQDGKYKIGFDYNPNVQHRLQHIAGVEFIKSEMLWEVGTDKKDFVVRAVNDMRNEVVADRADREQISKVANEKIDDAKVRDAFTKDGQSYTGTVLAKNDRYVLQHTGKDYTVLHRVSAMKEIPPVGRSVKVTYQQGRGEVVDKTQQKAQAQGMEH
jgi:molybdopterin converting factor small subunit